MKLRKGSASADPFYELLVQKYFEQKVIVNDFRKKLPSA